MNKLNLYTTRYSSVKQYKVMSLFKLKVRIFIQKNNRYLTFLVFNVFFIMLHYGGAFKKD